MASFEDVHRDWLPFPFLSVGTDPVQREMLAETLRNANSQHINVGTDGFAYVQYLQWDSTFFERKIHMIGPLYAKEGGAHRVLDCVEASLSDSQADYAFVKLPSVEKRIAAAFEERGWSLIETRVTYWTNALQSFSAKRRFAVRKADSADVLPLSDVAVKASNPLDRFRADSFFPEKKVDLFMAEWIKNSINKGFSDWVLTPVSGPKAFMTIQFLDKEAKRLHHRLSQLVLSAVAPDAVGWYPRLVSESLLLLKERGCGTVFMTTQAGNGAVVRSWEHFGLSPACSTLVFRKIFSGNK